MAANTTAPKANRQSATRPVGDPWEIREKSELPDPVVCAALPSGTMACMVVATPSAAPLPLDTEFADVAGDITVISDSAPADGDDGFEELELVEELDVELEMVEEEDDVSYE